MKKYYEAPLLEEVLVKTGDIILASSGDLGDVEDDEDLSSGV